jgi:hypothetical protein
MVLIQDHKGLQIIETKVSQRLSSLETLHKGFVFEKLLQLYY